MTAREIFPFREFGPNNEVRREGDFGAYPVPSETPDPKAAAPVGAKYQDLIPPIQPPLPAEAAEDFMQNLSEIANHGSTELPAARTSGR